MVQRAPDCAPPGDSTGADAAAEEHALGRPHSPVVPLNPAPSLSDDGADHGRIGYGRYGRYTPLALALLLLLSLLLLGILGQN